MLITLAHTTCSCSFSSALLLYNRKIACIVFRWTDNMYHILRLLRTLRLFDVSIEVSWLCCHIWELTLAAPLSVQWIEIVYSGAANFLNWNGSRLRQHAVFPSHFTRKIRNIVTSAIKYRSSCTKLLYNLKKSSLNKLKTANWKQFPFTTPTAHWLRAGTMHTKNPCFSNGTKKNNENNATGCVRGKVCSPRKKCACSWWRAREEKAILNFSPIQLAQCTICRWAIVCYNLLPLSCCAHFFLFPLLPLHAANTICP